MAISPPVKVTGPKSLHEELTRIADICHGCRRCFSLCPSFDTLFKGLDVPDVDGEAEKLPRKVLDDFVDLCYECRLCVPHCPYVPPHRWGVHIPHAVLEARRVRVEEEGVPLRDRLLSRPDTLGRMSSAFPSGANFVSTLPVVRKVMEKTLGISAKKALPRYAAQTFTSWFRGRKSPAATAPPVERVVFFPTCTVEWNRPEIGIAAVEVLERNGVEVKVEYPGCCGMPFLDVGDVDAVHESRKTLVATLKPWVDRGYLVVTTGPSCSLMIKKEYAWLAGNARQGAGTDAADAAVSDPDTSAVSARTRDLGEFLMELKTRGALDTSFSRAPKSIAYHLPCHLKVQNIGYRSRDLLALTGAAITMVERCSGHDGTWAMKAEYFDESMKVGSKLFAQLTEAGADVVSSDCPLAGMQITQGTGRDVLHPVEVLRDAYGPRDPGDPREVSR